MKDLIKDRIDILVEKAKQGDFESQYELAKSFYYGKLVERSLPLARYWAFKAITNPDKDHTSDIYNLYQSANAPHFTDNERYVSFGTSYDISLTGSSLWGSTKFRGKFDIYPDDKKYYRTYYITRFIIFCFIRGAYRVYEPERGSYRIYGKEKMHFKEYGIWLMPYVLVALFFIFRSLLSF